MVGEADRKILKAAIKHNSTEDQVRHRIVPAETIQTWMEKLASLNADIAGTLEEEKEEKHVSFALILFDRRYKAKCRLQMRKAEMELKKGQNMIEHEAEIYSRPARTWFQSTKDKQKAEGLLGANLTIVSFY